MSLKTESFMENLFYKKLHSTKRTYFFNVLKNDKGNLVVQIIESQASKGGGYRRKKINIHEEDSSDFLDILNDAVSLLEKHKNN